MNRKRLAENHGMIFKFPHSSNLSFWMRDTYIPLDVAFIDDDGRILQIESMSPLSTRPVRSSNLCRYALEVNKGWFAKNNIDIGDIVLGEGISGRNIHRQAQMDLPDQMGLPDQMTMMDGQEQQGAASPIDPSQDGSYQTGINPDVMLNLDYKTRLQNANAKGDKLIIIYQKKDGYVLPPKAIVPPFLIGPDEAGNHDALLTAWDDQDGQWKSFLIDNILNMQEHSSVEQTVISS